MKIYAAIDLRQGRCVRLMQGNPNAETVYSEDPVAIAAQWAAAGTDWLHIVNLDGAFGDETSPNLTALEAILNKVETPVQFGGGLRSPEDVARAFELGVSRVVIGSLAAQSPNTMQSLLDQYGPEKIALGLDVKDGKVATHGWQQVSQQEPLNLARSFYGLTHVIYTDIARDGMLIGVNLARSIELAQLGNYQIIVSGGVASLHDIEQIKAAEEAGLEGVIIGKALYTGAITLPHALKIAHGGD